jgi:hypothetical protein
VGQTSRRLEAIPERSTIGLFNGQRSRRRDWACNRRLHGLGRAIEDAKTSRKCSGNEKVGYLNALSLPLTIDGIGSRPGIDCIGQLPAMIRH